MDYIIYFAITIGILVFIHELGHFLAAKMTGMRADVFAIGFGKRLFGYNKKTGFSFGDLPKDFDGEGHTDYRLSLLPLGGYVKIAGMVDESFDTEFADKEPQPYEFRAKNFWQKTFVITAGVVMNLLLAIFIFWGANYFKGKPVTLTTTVGYVRPDSPADSLGFKRGDIVESVNDVTVFKEAWSMIENRTFFGDKIYFVNDLNESMKKHQNSEILAPIKAVKGIPDVIKQRIKAADDLFSTAVSRIRQPVESMFNWLIEKADIQKASKVRSTNGLLIHAFGRLAVAFISLAI